MCVWWARDTDRLIGQWFWSFSNPVALWQRLHCLGPLSLSAVSDSHYKAFGLHYSELRKWVTGAGGGEGGTICIPDAPPEASQKGKTLMHLIVFKIASEKTPSVHVGNTILIMRFLMPQSTSKLCARKTTGRNLNVNTQSFLVEFN